MNLYKAIRTYLPGVISWLFNIHVHGSENEPPEGGYIACSNHISFVDVLTLAVAVKRQLRYMAKKELFSVPVLGSIVKACGAFPVDRKGSAVAALKKSIAILESGEPVGMFPTGHRFSGVKFDSTKGEVKAGVAMTACRAKVPVLPMFISTKNDKVLLFRRIDVYVGKPIAYEEFGFTKGGTEEYERGAALIYERIAELMPEERKTK